ncbi:hypothetical protein QA601_02225 [Chitinispirillales bacterium ANBcel5]|uniref:hypothetical protein n=1 Tax=Cellulosispirillum alkaliphilum TaxID=3039283 RepID=UPI002A562E10|nr:hypothetical protein [Chitinispirillales bacterium ANBcel5]
MSRFFMGSICVALTTIIIGCGGSAPSPVNIESKGTFALVSFSLHNSIVERGKEADSGPGLLQDKENYYGDHMVALEDMMDQFFDNKREIFISVPFIGLNAITENEYYANETKHVPRMVMGRNIAPGANMLTAREINYVSPYDSDKLDNLAEELGADVLVMVENNAEFYLSGGLGLSVGNLNVGGGAGTLNLKTRVIFYEPGQGIIVDNTFSNDSDEKIPMIQGTVDTKDFPRCIAPAMQLNIADMKSFFIEQKEKALELETQEL